MHKKIFGAIDYQYKPPFGLGLDHQWLGFFQYTTGDVFARYGTGRRDPYGEYGRSGSQRIPVQVFDPRARWLLDHQEARPYGTAPILPEEAGACGEAAAGSGAGSARGGAAGRGQAGPPP